MTLDKKLRRWPCRWAPTSFGVADVTAPGRRWFPGRADGGRLAAAVSWHWPLTPSLTNYRGLRGPGHWPSSIATTPTTGEPAPGFIVSYLRQPHPARGVSGAAYPGLRYARTGG